MNRYGHALAPGEQALWALQQLVPGLGVSNVSVAVEMEEPVRWWPMQDAIDRAVAAHAALRRCFPTEGAIPVRVDAPAGAVKIELKIDDCAGHALEGALRRFAAAAFDLSRAPLMRIGLFVVDGTRNVLCLAAHHIIVDAASLSILAADICHAYAATCEGNDPPRRPPVPPTPQLEPSPETLERWREHIEGIDAGGMQLSEAKVPRRQPTFAGRRIVRQSPPGLIDALAALRRRCRATDAIVLLAAYYVTLHKHGAAEDSVVGVMVDTRGHGRADEVGYHVVTVPLRVRVRPPESFTEVVSRVSAELVAGIDRGPVPFELLARDSTADADNPAWWRNRLVRHLFNYRSGKATGRAEPPRHLTEVCTGLSRFDLELTVEPSGPSMALLHSTEVHSTPFAGRFLDRLEQTIMLAAADPDRPIGEYDLRTETDRRVAAEANRTDRSWPIPHTVLGLVNRAAAANPSAVAIVHDGRTTTYRELVSVASSVRDLVLRHARPGGVVAIASPRSAETAAAVLGVWAAGASYLPIDPNNPEARIRQQLEDTNCRVVLGADGLPAGCHDGRTCLPVPVAGAVDRLVLLPEPDPSALAYVIFTSGSTGRPKGVRLTHANLANVVRHFADTLALGPDAGMIWLTSLAFDISVLELCVPLVVGGRAVVAGDDAPAHPHRLIELIERERVAVVQATPTTWRLTAPLAAGRLTGRTVLSGGEPLSPTLAGQLLATGARVLNVYGPTETTIWSTAAEITDPAQPITVGRPIANTQVHVIDASGVPQPIGLPGELCIAGAGVANGYHERPELTAQRFTAVPGLGRVYRTGDRARWRPDGTLELIGRADRQVKLRAHRIELGEIESVLESHPDVSAAVAVMAGDPSGDGVIAAFVIASRRADLATELWRHAAEALPSYSVPARITVLDELPRTANGKVDHHALIRLTEREPDSAHVRTGHQTSDAVESELIKLWRSVLQRESLGRDANFFLSGGHSLLAARLAAEAGQALGLELTMGMVFRAPTPARLAELIRLAVTDAQRAPANA